MATYGKPNAQYNVAAPNSLAMHVGGYVRTTMFETFMDRLKPLPNETVLDVGATSDRSYEVSNYFEARYSFPANIVAAGLDDASFLEEVYPGLRFVQANALSLPFADRAFDLVHSSAVLEHVGSLENQARMVAECLRVARRGVCLTTPNRWFPVEVHTHLPFVHWLPKPMWRALARQLGYSFFADEQNLNLMSRRTFERITTTIEGWTFEIVPARLLGWTSNLQLFARRS